MSSGGWLPAAIAERGELAPLKLTPDVNLPLDWTTQKRVVGIE